MNAKRGTGESVVVHMRLKKSGVTALDEWAKEAGVDRTEFVRGLLRAEAKARAAGRSVYVGRPSNS